ncbi:hypothetical protein D3C76_510380 [compost metagenome]
MLGIAEYILAGPGIQPPLGAVLATVSLVRDHDDIGAVGEQRVSLFTLQQRELLHRGKDNATSFTRRQHLTQLIAVARLNRGSLEQVAGSAEGGEQLAVQIIAVRHHHQRGVLHFWLLQQLACVAGHGDALT